MIITIDAINKENYLNIVHYTGILVIFILILTVIYALIKMYKSENLYQKIHIKTWNNYKTIMTNAASSALIAFTITFQGTTHIQAALHGIFAAGISSIATLLLVLLIEVLDVTS